MDLSQAALLLAAGLAAGTVNAVAGGGSLITFPTLVALGLPPIAANVTNSIAVCPGYLAAVGGSRADLAGQARRLRTLLPVTAVGTAAGCVLLLVTPARAFELIVPFLVLAAAGLLAFQQKLKDRFGRLRPAHPALVPVTVGLAAVYGGYFGAAVGVVLVATLALLLAETLARVGAAKNAISAVVGLVTVVVFAGFGPVNWAAVAVLTPATLLGGYAGARLARRLPTDVLRAVIVIFGVVAGILLLLRA